MTNPNQEKVQSLKISDFTYELAEEKIAKFPLQERDSSKLLIYKDNTISEDIYRNIANYIPGKSLLFFNNTKVIQARIQFNNSTGARIEIFCLEQADDTEPVDAMIQTKTARWKCFVGKANKWREKKLETIVNGIKLEAEQISKTRDVFIIEFKWEPESLTFVEVLENFGEIPIPPYLKRKGEKIDNDRYQTVYSKEKGSIAAPTAGLHFTEKIFADFKKHNISTEYVTLHVGAGTFKPVKSEVIQDHIMHSEWIEVELSTIMNLIELHSSENEPGNVIAVGTTSLRTVETLYWMGVKALNNPDAGISDLEIKQWDPYVLDSNVSILNSLKALVKKMNELEIKKLICKTQVLIAPPYELKICQALITNFHQPNSTLLLLVAAIVGEKWKLIYNHALNNDYRFLSYGDGCLLFR